MRSVVVTGASSGIGRATALELDSRGWTVFAGYRKPEDGEGLRAAGSSLLVPVRVDVTNPSEIDALAERVDHDTGEGGLQGLVNNAGIPVGGPLEFVSDEEIRQQFDVNLFGQLAVTRALLPALRRGPGRVANMTSIGGRVASPFFGPYVASKFALEGVSDTLRRELHDFGIWVSAIEPGSVATPIWGQGIERGRALATARGAEIERVYPGKIDRMLEVTKSTGERGIPPERVAKIVHRALTARRPRARYLVGVDAHVMAYGQRLLPTRVFDAIVRSQAG